MATVQKTISKWNGGISASQKSGLPNSFRFAKHLDIFSDDDSVTLLPTPIKDTASVVTGLVRWMVSAIPYIDSRWGYDDAGNIYSTSAYLTWTLRRAVGGDSIGQGLLVFSNFLYYATATTMGRGGLLSAGVGSMAYDNDYLSDGTTNLDLSVTASGNTYTPLTGAPSETATNRETITPTKDPLKTIAIYVTAKGTGNWTVTLHDSLNNSLGSATIANASLTNGAMNSFTFSTPARIDIGTSYHFHVTSTVADGTMQTGTASDLETSQHKTYFGILVSNDFHPMAQHTNGVGGTVIIGNDNYLAELVPGVSYDPNKIEIEPGFTIRGITRENEYIVAYAWRGESTDITEEGKLFYWDGIQPYYNYSKPVSGGVPNAMGNYKNRVFSVIGGRGIMTLGTEPFQTIQSAPNLGRGKIIEVLPGAMASWQNRMHIGIGTNSTDSTSLIQGIYEYGNQSDRATSSNSVSTEVLNFAYTMSTGDETGATMRIGCVAVFGVDMYFSWKSQAGTYGVDRVTVSNDPATTGSWESLIDDDTAGKSGFVSAPHHQKESQRLIIRYLNLPTGCTVTPKYKLERAASWTYGTGTDIGTAGTTFCTMDIGQRYYEIEFGFDLVATTGYPTILSITHEFDPLKDETNPPY